MSMKAAHNPSVACANSGYTSLLRLQTNHHAHLFVVTHSYPTCPLPTSPLDLFESASFEIGLKSIYTIACNIP